MFAAEATAPSGSPSVETTMWYFVPRLPRSVGFGPVRSPPRLARTLQLSTTMSKAWAAASGPDRAMRSSTACTRGSSATSRHSRSRRRSVEPEARPVPAKSSRHCTPSRKKNCKVLTTSAAGRRGRPRSPGSFSNCSTIPETRSIAVTLNVHSLATYTSIYGDAYTGLSYAEARYLYDVERPDYWKPPLNPFSTVQEQFGRPGVVGRRHQDRQNQAERAGQDMTLHAFYFLVAVETTFTLVRAGDDALRIHDPGRRLRRTAVGLAHPPRQLGGGIRPHAVGPEPVVPRLPRSEVGRQRWAARMLKVETGVDHLA